MMKVIREYMDKGKGAERYTTEIRVDVMPLDSDVVIITEG